MFNTVIHFSLHNRLIILVFAAILLVLGAYQTTMLPVNQLPAGITPRMTPMASMMGQVMYLTIWDEQDQLSPMELRTLADAVVRKRILGSIDFSLAVW